MIKIISVFFLVLTWNQNETLAHLSVLYASIPNGLRLATEYALREKLANFVVCTSTLAQGVNLPIRYLIFTSIYQAGERLKVRDFHNLIGRAGRAGFQTEGTILFGDPEVFDKRAGREGWRFRSVAELMIVSNSEPCKSTLLSIFDPIQNLRRDMQINYEILQLFRDFFADETAIDKFVDQIVEAHADSGFDKKTVRKQVNWKLKIYTTIESYLIAALQDVAQEVRNTEAQKLATQTFAYDLASADQKGNLQELFGLISQRVDSRVALDSTKKTYGRTLLGLTDLMELDDWITNNVGQIVENIDNEDGFFDLIFPLVERFMEGSDLLKIDPPRVRPNFAKLWINGVSYHEILVSLQEAGAFVRAGTKKYELTFHHVVDICEGEFGFQGMLVVGALAELLESNPNYTDTTAGDTLRSLLTRTVRIYSYGVGMWSQRKICYKMDGGRERIKNLTN